MNVVLPVKLKVLVSFYQVQSQLKIIIVLIALVLILLIEIAFRALAVELGVIVAEWHL